MMAEGGAVAQEQTTHTVKIAVLDDYQGAAEKMADWDLLPGGIEVEIFNVHMSGVKTLATRLHEFHVISTMRERTPFHRELLSRLPNLKLLTTTGMQNVAIDLEAATDLGIIVCGTGGPTAPGLPIDMSDVVELTWGLLHCMARSIHREDAAVRRGRWQTSVGTSLKGKTLGLLGLGKLGSRVAVIGKAFGMRVIAWSQNLTRAAATDHGAELVTKDELFATSDFLSIHLKLGDRTRGLVGKHELGLMKPTACLINTSRGPIVEEKALIEVLVAGAIGGAALDVFEQEPLPAEHPFLSLENVLLSPHVGYVAENTYRVFFRDTVANIAAYLEGRPVRVMNPDVLSKQRSRQI